MNVYDFDHTIYDGDSTISFYGYCLKKYPAVLLDFPRQILAFLKYKTGRCGKTAFKEIFFCFLERVPDQGKTVNDFWDIHEHKIKKWYKSRQEEGDMIVSASPGFLLGEICGRLGIRYLIASEVDMRTGKFSSENCYGEEKVRRFLEKYPDMKIEKFYSDSYSDTPMALLAEEAFIVRKNKISEW